MKFYVLFFVITTTSCSTTYGPAGFSRGGYSEMRLATDTYKVSFRGNRYTSAEKVQNYLFRRCAQLTQNAHFSHFIIVDQQDLATRKQVEIGKETSMTSGYVQNYGPGQASFKETTVVSHPTFFEVTYCTSTALLKMFSATSHPENALNADEIMQQYQTKKNH